MGRQQGDEFQPKADLTPHLPFHPPMVCELNGQFLLFFFFFLFLVIYCFKSGYVRYMFIISATLGKKIRKIDKNAPSLKEPSLQDLRSTYFTSKSSGIETFLVLLGLIAFMQ